MAATQRTPQPCFLSFLKQGLLLPARNGGLFTPILALTAAFMAALVLTNSLAVQPVATAALHDASALQFADPESPGYSDLVKKLQSGIKNLVLIAAAYLLAAVIVGSAIKIVIVFAAVSTLSRDRHSLITFLSKVKANLKGPVLTIAFAYVIEIACLGLVIAMAAPFVLLLDYSLVLLFLDALLVFLGLLFLVYLTVVCQVAVVASAAEPGCCGAGAVARAWRLMKGKNAQAVVYVFVTCVLGAVVSPVYTVAVRSWPSSAACGVAAGVAYVLLLAAVQVFSTVAVAAYYFECRESKEEEEGASRHSYAKVASCDEANI